MLFLPSGGGINFSENGGCKITDYTAEGAGKWEEERIDTYKRNHGGDRPKYNQNDSGK